MSVGVECSLGSRRSAVALVGTLSLMVHALGLLGGCGPVESGEKLTNGNKPIGQIRGALSGGEESTSNYLVKGSYASFVSVNSISGSQPCILSTIPPETRAPLDEGWATVPIGFNFNYYGRATPYTSVNVSTNGFITFGTIPSVDASVNQDVRGIYAPGNSIFAWWDDLSIPSTSNCRYLTQGTSGSQTFTIEWQNATNNGSTGGIMQHTFQIVLHEGSNDIDINQGPLTVVVPGPNPSTASVGLSGENDTFGHTGVRIGDCTTTASCTESMWNSSSYRYTFSRPPYRYVVTKTPITYVPSTSGSNLLPTGGDRDDGYQLINLPQPFVFYGVLYNQVWVSVNGFITFVNPAGSYTWDNLPIPNSYAPNAMFMGWMDDMFLASVNDFRVRMDSSCFFCGTDIVIFEWNNWRHIDYTQPGNLGTTSHQMRIILYLSYGSRVEVQYGNISSTATTKDSASVGIEDPTASSKSIQAMGTACNGDCGETNWPANMSFVYSKPTFTYLYKNYFTKYGDHTLHCGLCHAKFQNTAHDDFRDQAGTYDVLTSGVDNVDESYMPQPLTCFVHDYSTGFVRYPYTSYGDSNVIMPRHNDGNVDPLGTLVTPDSSILSWFNTAGGTSHMPWDCLTGYYQQGEEELQTWFANGAYND